MLALISLVVIGCTVAVFKQPADDLAPFRPCALGEDHNYYQRGSGSLSTRHPGPYEAVRMTFDHMSPEQLKAIARSPFYAKSGWQKVEGLTPEVFLYKGSNPDNVKKIYAYRILEDGKPTDWVYVYEARPMSWFDVLMLRIKNIGRNPFDDKN